MLEASKICLTASGRRLLDDVSLTLHSGQRDAIVGATGSGKTVFLRALSQLDAIDSGTIRWSGETVRGGEIPQLRSRVIYLHQRPALFEGTVEENFLVPFRMQCHRRREYSRDKLLLWLDSIGRDASFLQQASSDLSGGEAQIVALLRAIQLEPAVLLLDEPTAALDEQTTRHIERLVLDWHSQAIDERAFIWVSHNKEQVARVADQVFLMTNGRLSSPATVAESSP